MVFPVVNLWFANGHQPGVNSIIADQIVPEVASYKFVPLTYQIFSRLGSNVNTGGASGSAGGNCGDGSGGGRTSGGGGDFFASGGRSSGGGGRSSGGDPPSFQSVLKSLVLKLCCDHPHHTLPQLFALAHEGEVSGKGAAEFKSNMSRTRCEGRYRTTYALCAPNTTLTLPCF